LLAWATAALLAGCGQVSFGEDFRDPDGGGVALDAGVDLGATDLGARDVGPPPDLGCIPVQLPSEPPEAWPFERSADGYREVFYSFAEPAGCASGGACHAGSAEPHIPRAEDLEARYDEAIDDLWPIIRSAPPLDRDDPSGRLWRHLPSHPDPAPPPDYQGPVPARLDGLVQQARDCNVARFLRSPPDAGAGCGGGAGASDVGAGAGADGGGPDAGAAAADASVSEAPRCFCPLPDAGALMTSSCAP
jgi:hypothetical protein